MLMRSSLESVMDWVMGERLFVIESKLHMGNLSWATISRFENIAYELCC
jgi:hypothetical protein